MKYKIFKTQKVKCRLEDYLAKKCRPALANLLYKVYLLTNSISQSNSKHGQKASEKSTFKLSYYFGQPNIFAFFVKPVFYDNFRFSQK